MELLLLFTVATIMAIFGAVGYYRGTTAMLIALLFLLGGFLLIELAPDTIITYMNGAYIGIMLVFKSGLNDIASGDLDSASQKLESIEKPFSGANEDLALLIVLGSVVILGFLVSLAVKKTTPSVLGGIFGLMYGYILSAGALPLILDVEPSLLPVPPIRPIATTPGAAGAGGGGASLSNFFTSLAEPGTVQILAVAILVGLAILLLMTVRRGVKKG